MYATTFGAAASVKLGQPVPLSNFVSASNRWVLQQPHSYRPGENTRHISELCARSVPCSRMTWNCSGLSSFFHSAGVLSTRLGGGGLPLRAVCRTSAQENFPDAVMKGTVPQPAAGCRGPGLPRQAGLDPLTSEEERAGEGDLIRRARLHDLHPVRRIDCGEIRHETHVFERERQRSSHERCHAD